VPLVRALERWDLERPITILVGENGSGKSTLLEGLAVAAGLPALGAEDVQTDPTLRAARDLARCLRLRWSRRTHRGFFLRAEDFFSFSKRVAALRAGLCTDLGEMEARFADRPAQARALATGPLRKELAALQERYGLDPDAASHGETFLRIFQSRAVPGGLYVLDEPEAALSPTRQLGLVALLGDLAGEGCQFVLATHSPVLMAAPGAAIFSCDEPPLRRVAYADLPAVTLLRDFLNRPEQFLRRL